MSYVFNPDGTPKNDAAKAECKRWHARTYKELAARKARIRKIIAVPRS
jgi:hypothetical protein